MDADRGPTPVLSIGAVDGGSQDGGRCADAVRALGRAVIAERAGVTSPVNINVVFHLAGRHLTPDFTGVRTGRYRKADSHLMVQASLFPEQVTDAEAEVSRLLREAVAEAEQWAKRRHLADSLDRLAALVGRVTDRK